jgi:hypothetical protein
MRVEEIEVIRLFKDAVKRSQGDYIPLVRTTYVKDIEILLEELDELRKKVKDLPTCDNPCDHCPRPCRYNIKYSASFSSQGHNDSPVNAR